MTRFHHVETAVGHFVHDALLDIYAPQPDAATAQRSASLLHFGATILGDHDWVSPKDAHAEPPTPDDAKDEADGDD